MKKNLVLLFTLLFISCHYSENFENREQDKIAAEKVTSELFNFIKKSDFESVEKLFDKKFFEVTTEDELKQILKATEEKIGKLKTTTLTEAKTRVSEGAIETGTYLLEYDCEFEKERAQLNITLVKGEDKKIRIVGYKVNSKAFLK